MSLQRVNFQPNFINQFILFCWLAARRLWPVALNCHPDNNNKQWFISPPWLRWRHKHTDSWRRCCLLTRLIAHLRVSESCYSLDFAPWLRLRGRPAESPVTGYPPPSVFPASLCPPAHFHSRRQEASGTLGEERVSLMAERRSWRWHLAGRVMVLDTAGGLLVAAPLDAAFGRVLSYFLSNALVPPLGSDSCKSGSDGERPSVCFWLVLARAARNAWNGVIFT